MRFLILFAFVLPIPALAQSAEVLPATKEDIQAFDQALEAQGKATIESGAKAEKKERDFHRGEERRQEDLASHARKLKEDREKKLEAKKAEKNAAKSHQRRSDDVESDTREARDGAGAARASKAANPGRHH